MYEYGVQNSKDADALDAQLTRLKSQIGDGEKQKVTVKGEIDRLQLEIKDGRQNDINHNAGLAEKIRRSDADLDKLEKELTRNVIPARQQKLATFNNECEKYNSETQRTENTLKEKETERQRNQDECEKQQKALMLRKEESLAEESSYYDLQYRQSYVAAEIEHK
jgi:chromosome segregation ATPase